MNMAPNPAFKQGPELMEWPFHTRMWHKMHGHDDGETGVDNETGSVHGHPAAVKSQSSKRPLAVMRREYPYEQGN